VVRYTFIIFGLFITPNLCPPPPRHKILATPLRTVVEFAVQQLLNGRRIALKSNRIMRGYNYDSTSIGLQFDRPRYSTIHVNAYLFGAAALRIK